MLTIGDGLVTVIPALMISISGGLIVTRASSEAQLGAEFRKQIFGNAQPLMLAGGVLVALAAVPRHADDSLPAAGRRHRVHRLDAQRAGEGQQGCRRP